MYEVCGVSTLFTIEKNNRYIVDMSNDSNIKLVVATR